ncbi:MAG: hypothetical protein J6U54_03975 [Clostridiales bacterium]|nr:hypothetical protein [Clostridiales bacterium]
MAKITLEMLKTIVESTKVSIEMKKQLFNYGYFYSEDSRHELSKQANESKMKLQALLEQAIAAGNEESSCQVLKCPCSAYDMSFQIIVRNGEETVFSGEIRIPDWYR